MTDLPNEAECSVREAVEQGESVFPEGHFEVTGGNSNPQAVKRASLASLRERLNGEGPEVEAVVVGDAGDADGGSSTAVLRHKFGASLPENVIDFNADYPFQPLFDDTHAGGLISLPASHRGYYPNPLDVIEETLDVLEEEGATDIPVYVVDLGANEADANSWITQFNRENPILVRDHHTPIEDVMAAADEYVHDPDRCATEIVLDTDHPDAPQHLHDLAADVRIIDLWLDDHPEFQEKQMLGDAHFTLGDAVFERLAAHYGPEITTDVQGVSDELQERKQVKEAKIQYAVDNAEFHTFDTEHGEVIAASTAGDFYASEVGRRLYTDHGADIVIMAKHSGSVSLRTHDDYAVADEIAQRLGGGGHPAAAGFDNPAPEDSELDVKRRIAVAEVSGVIEDALATQEE